jgi:dTDP-D-glucose 4,6-dehydratase
MMGFWFLIRFEKMAAQLNQRVEALKSYYQKEGLLETACWYLEHDDWIQAISRQNDYQAWLEKNYAERKEGRK